MLSFNLRIHGGRVAHFQSEVEVRASGWLLGFSDPQVEPQYLSLGFYYSCYIWCQHLAYKFTIKPFVCGITVTGQSNKRPESLP